MFQEANKEKKKKKKKHLKNGHLILKNKAPNVKWIWRLPQKPN